MDAKRGQFQARVVGQRPLCRDHNELELAVEAFPVSGPGQFISLPGGDPDAGEELRQPVGLLRRPFSIADRNDDRLRIIYRVVGKGTQWLARCGDGHNLDVIGPLGRGYDLSDGIEEALLVAGGVGIGPMTYLAHDCVSRGIPAVAFIGAATDDLLPVKSSRACYEIPVFITTDDGSSGKKGFVTEALSDYLDSVRTAPKKRIFACGPTPMLAEVARIAQRCGAPCQVSLEQRMGCGIGTCQGCVCPIGETRDEEGFIYKRVCADGPVFDAGSILWERMKNLI